MEAGAPRKKTPAKVEADVLVASGQRCCVCYGRHGKREVVRGQIANLDRRRDNPSFRNLAFLCLEHHDEYDARHRQSKGLTKEAVVIYRDRLYKELHSVIQEPGEPSSKLKLPEDLQLLFESELKWKELGKNWRLIAAEAEQDYLFAYTSANDIRVSVISTGAFSSMAGCW